MADIAPKLLHLSAEKLVALHERIHKSEISPASLEVHHTILNEMARRKMERPQDNWDTYEILVDSIEDVEIASLGNTFPADMLAKIGEHHQQKQDEEGRRGQRAKELGRGKLTAQHQEQATCPKGLYRLDPLGKKRQHDRQVDEEQEELSAVHGRQR